MAKYRRSKRKSRMPLTPVQLQERKRRRMLMKRMMYGMSTPKGTRPRTFIPTDEAPVLKPMPQPSFTDPFAAIMGFVQLLPWMRRRKRERELAAERESQNIKDKGWTS